MYAESKGEKQLKHTRMLMAIEELVTVVHFIRNLRSKIDGYVEPPTLEKQAEERQTETLADVLAYGPERILDLCEQCKKEIAIIEDNLF